MLRLVTEFLGPHRHVQVYEDEAGEGGFRPKSDNRPALLSECQRQGLCPTYTGHIQFSDIREDQNLKLLSLSLPVCTMTHQPFELWLFYDL